jgi:hypothetical protein
MSETTPQPGGPSKEELKAAFKAFKKRLKLTRLEDESKLSRRPTTTGQGSGIFAIQPPNQFSDAVWEELARQGKIKKTEPGMYELVVEE